MIFLPSGRAVPSFQLILACVTKKKITTIKKGGFLIYIKTYNRWYSKAGYPFSPVSGS